MTYESVLKELALSDEKYVCITAENRALIRNLPAVLNERFIDVGITEQTMVGLATGMALQGRVPIIHALATFLTMRAFEFIRTDIGISGLPVKLTGFIPGFLSDGNGPTHQAIEDVSIMRGIPGMQVFCPADEQDMLMMLKPIWQSSKPCYLRANTRKATIEHEPFNIGKAEVLAEGNDITILTYGMLLEEAIKAKANLEQEDLSVGLVNMRSLKPVDEQAIINAVEGSEMVITLEDHFLTGGLYSIVAETLLKYQTTGFVYPISLGDKWFKPGLLKDVLEYEGFTADKITEKILHTYQENL